MDQHERLAAAFEQLHSTAAIINTSTARARIRSPEYSRCGGIKNTELSRNNFSAEYGLTTGSQMVIVSKGGSNRWHGDVFEYLRNNHLDAAQLFLKLSPHCWADSVCHSSNATTSEAALGGPIRKDKTFFLLVYEGLRTAQQDAIQDTRFPEQCHS